MKFGMMTLNKEVISEFQFGATFSDASGRPNGSYRAFQSALVGQGQSFYPLSTYSLGHVDRWLQLMQRPKSSMAQLHPKQVHVYEIPRITIHPFLGYACLVELSWGPPSKGTVKYPCPIVSQNTNVTATDQHH